MLPVWLKRHTVQNDRARVEVGCKTTHEFCGSHTVQEIQCKNSQHTAPDRISQLRSHPLDLISAQ